MEFFTEHVLIFIYEREMCDFYSILEALKTPNLLHLCGVTCSLELGKADLNSRALVFRQIWGFVCLLVLFLVLVVVVIVVVVIDMFLLRE